MVESFELAARRCRLCTRGMAPLHSETVAQLLTALHEDWTLSADERSIVRRFRFADYPQTIAFVNAVAGIAGQADHHPDLTVTYGKVEVVYTTHAADGLSENDFICAAKIDHL